MMNSRHLPAGQPPDHGRRRQYHPNQQYPQQQQQMYNNPYMHQYNANYYPQQHMPPQYHNPAIPPQHQYNPYPPYVRSPPPPMQHYPHPPIPQQQSHYASRPHAQQSPRPQQSPVVVSAYKPPPPPVTPSTSTQSSQTVPVPMTPPTPQTALSVAPSSPPEEHAQSEPFRAPLPWLSHPDIPWPTRRARRKRKQNIELSADAVLMGAPNGQHALEVQGKSVGTENVPAARPETPSTTHPTSEEAHSTNPTTPSSVQQAALPAVGDATPVALKSTPKSAAPTVPAVPALPKPLPQSTSAQSHEKSAEEKAGPATVQEVTTNDDIPVVEEVKTSVEENTAPEPAPQAWTKPKLWAGLFNSNAATSKAATSDSEHASGQNFGKSNTESLAEALRSFSASPSDSKVTFLKPRGLVNTGNMCYMNSVLQVLVSCTPFFTFLDQAGKKAAHSFKSDTPLIDAMIMFMREYPVIDSAVSVEQLRMRLKEGELEDYGEPFTPEYVYDVIKRLPRFSSMRRGHQQDAEEFLGFLLEGLHDECVQVMRASASNTTSAIATPANGPSSPINETATVAESSAKENGWLEVGPKQKSAVTRSSGAISTNSPITKIFGGQLRSELRVPGLKDSVTLEPYQPLQLDIGAPNVNNIIDALKGLTRSETLHGDFKSPKGSNVAATKQVFIESVPPVLILHLKRFQYDNAGGTQKIWKKVGYPLELEIPKDVFNRQKRSVLSHGGLPKYKLTAVVYHHGKNASGGHYTVDVRRQDGREWIRLDDTVIRRVRSEDVAEGGSEEDPKVLAAALEAHKKDTTTSANIFSSFGDEEESVAEDGWKQASGPGKKWSSIVNGASTPKAKADKSSIKDNKVAYLLFYQKI